MSAVNVLAPAREYRDTEMKTHLTGLALGLAIGLIDCALFAMSGAQLSPALITVAVVFWTTVGWIVHTMPTKLPYLFKGIVISWLMNLPWFVEYTVLQGLGEMALPMIILATLFGACLGLLSKRLH